MRVIPLKIPRKISTIGFARRCWMWGTECRLEQLMMLRGFRNINNNYEARKTALPHILIKESVGINP